MTSETLRYIRLDYQSQKDALLQRIRDRWPQRWNDFLANSIGIVLVDVVAWALATLSYTINRTAGENYIPTMSLRESAVRIGALTGYQLRGATPATVACEATLTTAQAADVIIAKGTLIRSSDSNALPFEVVQDYTIPAGSLTPSKTIATFSPALSGVNVISTYLSVENGSSLATPIDSTIDLSAYIEPGQSLRQLGDTSEADVYGISSITEAPGAVSAFSQIVLDRPWSGLSGRIAAQVYDRRIQLIQGQTVVDRFVAPVSTVGYVVKLTQMPVLDGSISVDVNGVTWNQSSTVGIQNAFAQVYQAKTATTGETLIVFGDGVFGAAVPQDAAVTVTYRIGGGSAGNVQLSAISTTLTALLATVSSPVPVSIENSTTVGIGGQDAETLDQARVNIPYYTRTNDRAVTLDDYQTIAQQYSSSLFGSVAYARSGVRTENSLLEGNVVSVYAWTTGPGGGLVPITGQLKTAVRDYLQSKAVGTDYVQMLDGTSSPVPISLQFKVLPGYSITEVKSLIVSDINTRITNLRPGDPLIYSDLVASLDSTTGVDNLVFATPIGNLYTHSSTELFTVPQSNYAYTLEKFSQGTVTAADGRANKYTVQFPVYPLQAWSFSLALGVNQLSVLPYIAIDSSGRVQVQQARIAGENISTDDSYPSTVNLLTGQATLYVIGAPGDLTMKLVTAQGYSSERVVNLYISYRGDVSQSKRREIRSALSAWGQGFGVGNTIYAQRVSGVPASNVSVSDMVASIPGVDSVTRVSLDTPSNAETRVVAADYELLRIGTVIINNLND